MYNCPSIWGCEMRGFKFHQLSFAITVLFAVLGCVSFFVKNSNIIYRKVMVGQPGLSRVRTSMPTSGGRPDASDDPTDVRLGGRPPADVLRPWRGRPPAAGAILQGRPTEADGCPVRWGPSAIAVHRKRSASAVHPGPSACAVRSL
jgi:hypothetical protein